MKIYTIMISRNILNKMVTARGIVNNTIEAIKDSVEAVKYITTSYISKMVNNIVDSKYRR